ncbi:alpha-D-ribose 1-methylphosphonate 5-triphosphate diphosphatase [Gracilibacillus ureilyticus]|uniref:Alpha-D-ribose 1-methylphosphonate 5-triphosphate diphosphatase n=1 Tax=Gracilibacillus ureilyticus TaxID=531814 RepID=A0A1H9MQY7_9BACI|nr:phosphonate metabolism protein PhnM [Gracilibacillus ureilyticus]SER26130.1 alpha-D-ribose 1-methylphosphonate 5-triphosphate diphosphatase [Gracilibacillus ureilyticus]
MYIIHNGKIITEDSILTGHAVVVDGETIHALIEEDEINQFPEAELIDARGGYVSPGFIDIHSDYIETVASPRPNSVMDFNLSLREAEKILIGHGITTMFHSLSFYRKEKITRKHVRYPDNMQRMIDQIDETHHKLHMIRHRLHARFEMDNIDGIDQLIDNIRSDKVHLVSFMDHTPGQGQYRNLEIYRQNIKGHRNISDEEVNVLLAERKSTELITIEKITEVAELALSKGIAIASHDDDNVSKLELVKSYGTTISEFPVALEIAKKAKEHGLYTIVGAPNVLLGGSHSGNLSAAEAIDHGYADILCSDYYPAALLHAIFHLHDKQEQDLHKMFMMVTLNPAKAVSMDEEIGSIKIGKKADLLVIERMDDGYPMLTATMVNGQLMTTTNYRSK